MAVAKGKAMPLDVLVDSAAPPVEASQLDRAIARLLLDLVERDEAVLSKPATEREQQVQWWSQPAGSVPAGH